MKKAFNLNNITLVAIVGIVAIVAIIFGFSYESNITGYATYTSPGNGPAHFVWNAAYGDPDARPKLECVIVDFKIKPYQKLFKKDMEYYKMMINCARVKTGVTVDASGYNGSVDSVQITYG